MRLVAITGGQDVPSRRFRIHALVPYLRDVGIQMTELCPRIPRHPPVARSLRGPWLLAALLERATFIGRARGHDAVVLQRELISTLPTFEHLLPGPRILDVDDAIYLRRGGHAARHAARASVGVVCGNSYLADHFSSWCDRVAIIPTGIDTEALRPQESREPGMPPVIGWIGTSANLTHLDAVAASLERVLASVPGSTLHIISDQPDAIPARLMPSVRFTRWRPGIETTELPGWTVGIMPLSDSDWTRGKCSFKLLQYLAAGIPVVASPVGMNCDVLAQADVGHLARSDDDWVDALKELLTDEERAGVMGANGRMLVEQRYGLTRIARQWREVAERWLCS